VSDFTLEPDEIERERPASARPLRLISTGIAPTADVPRSTKPDPPLCYTACEACGLQVLTGTTSTGTRLALDTNIPTFVVAWTRHAATPRLLESRGYPLHRCAAAGGLRS
jgi:hypothetical protein